MSNINLKERFNSIYGLAIANKKILFTNIFILLILFLFPKPISLLIELLIYEIDSPIISDGLQKILFIGLYLLTFIYYIYIIVNGYRHWKYITYTVAYIFILYFYCRFYVSITASHSDLYSNIVLLDVLIIFIALWEYVYIQGLKDLKPQENQNTSRFIINNEDDYPAAADLLGRQNIIDELGDEVIKLYSKNSFSIGISAKWGDGKTFFIKKLIARIESYDTESIILHFNPWLSNSSVGIYKSFFTAISEKLSVFDDNISAQINNYSNNLIEADSTGFFKLANTIQGESAIDENLTVLKTSIKQLGKKVIIIVDDIDRLESKEVFEVLRLIRNTANLPGFIFITAFDKEYIENSLKELKIHSPNIYLHKIFSYEYELPLIDKEILFEQLTTYILNGVEKNTSIYKEAELALKGKSQDVLDYLDEDAFISLVKKALTNIRDIQRLYNTFIFKYGILKGDVSFKELLILDIIKLKSVQLYNLIKQKQIIDEPITAMFGGTHYYKYKKDKIPNDLQKEIEANPVLEKLVLYLFPIEEGRIDIDNRSVSLPYSFPRYFEDDTIRTLGITYAKFLDILSLGLSQFETDILNTYNDEKLLIFLNRIQLLEIFKDKEEFEFVISKLVFIGKRYSDNNIIANRVISLLYKFLSVRFFEKQLKQYYADTIEYINSLESFIVQLDFSKYSYFMSEFARVFYLNNGETNLLHLNITKNNALLLNQLKDFLSSSSDNLDFDRFTTLVQAASYINGTIRINTEVSALSKSFFDIYPNKILLNSLTQQNDFAEVKMFQPVLELIYGSIENYIEDFVKRQPPSIPALNIISFYTRLRNSGLSGLIYPENKIEFVSDESVSFTGSPTYTEIPASQSVELINHPWRNIILRNYPLFVGAKIIGHAITITPNEGKLGGIYNFTKTVDLSGVKKKNIQSATLYFIVDDKAKIKLNSTLLNDNITAGADKIYYLELIDSLIFGEVNLFEFEIENYNAQDIGLADNFADGNPYGFIYNITLTLNQSSEN